MENYPFKERPFIVSFPFWKKNLEKFPFLESFLFRKVIVEVSFLVQNWGTY